MKLNISGKLSAAEGYTFSGASASDLGQEVTVFVVVFSALRLVNSFEGQV